MASEIKANKLSPATGADVVLGDSSDTFTAPSGVTIAIASGATITNSGTATGFGLTGWSEDGGDNDLLPASASAGIYLGVSSATAANLLDDYEEGAWSPVPKAGATDINMASASTGAYYKFGKVVYLRAQLRMNRGTSTGAFTVTGLPFAPDDSTYGAGSNCHLSSRPNDSVMVQDSTGPYIWSIDNSSIIYAFATPADTSSAIGNSSVVAMMSASSDRYLTICMTYSTS